MRILTGIQSSGALHLGNYLGAMLPAIRLQDQGEAYYFIANYHSLTSLTDPQRRRQYTLDVALDFLACGLDPQRCVFWRQSDTPEHTELAWILSTITPMGLLERAHSYKDKKEKLGAGDMERVNHGLFAYPVLMAADILLYNAQIVPVGRDQKQHLEMTRDIAIKFNHLYGEVFVIPEPRIQEDVAVVPGIDGQKMSKSYGNTLEIFGEEKVIRKKIMGIVMDSRGVDEPKPDAHENLVVRMFKLLDPAEGLRQQEKLAAGGYGYGGLKKAFFEYYWEYFAEARKRREAFAADTAGVESMLMTGAAKARDIARPTLRRARQACGLE